MFEAQQPIWPTESLRCALGSLGSSAISSTSGIHLQTNGGRRGTCLKNVWSDQIVVILLFYNSGHLQDTLQKWYEFCGVMCHFQLPSISIFNGASDEKHFVRDLTTFDICAHVNSFFRVFRQETRKKLCKWIFFWILMERVIIRLWIMFSLACLVPHFTHTTRHTRFDDCSFTFS